MDIPIRLVLLIPLFPSIFLLMSLLAGIGWAMLAVTLLHLSITLMPFSDTLARLLLGQSEFTRFEGKLRKTADSLVYRFTFVFSNLSMFVLTAMIFFIANFRLIDLFKK